MEVYPNYYKNFTCIADKCKHSCCIGWEIDIDENTMELYNSIDTMGERLRENIEGDPPHFILREEDRCPFLNEKGLCDIIIKLDEDALCDICTLHPRFKNFYENFEEVGLGLCCEEAVRVVIDNDEKFEIRTPSLATKDEKEFLKIREAVFDILQNREKTMLSRFEELADKFSLKFDFSISALRDMYLSLERLDEKWSDELLKLGDLDKKIFDKYPIYFEQLAIYFVFRHFCEGNERESVNFSLMSCYLLGALWSRYEDKEKMFDLVRMYSCEVEYSEENLEIMRGILYEER